MGLKSKVATGAGALVLALGLVVKWEGYEPQVYLDPVGIPTVCYGHVVDPKVPVGTVFSNAACHNILYSDLKIASDAVDKLAKVPLKDNEKAAFVSFVFNTGVGNFKRSTMLRYINEGSVQDACHELPKWVYATKNGVKVKLNGLVNRRQAEMKLCLGET